MGWQTLTRGPQGKAFIGGNSRLRAILKGQEGQRRFIYRFVRPVLFFSKLLIVGEDGVLLFFTLNPGKPEPGENGLVICAARAYGYVGWNIFLEPIHSIHSFIPYIRWKFILLLDTITADRNRIDWFIHSVVTYFGPSDDARSRARQLLFYSIAIRPLLEVQ